MLHRAQRRGDPRCAALCHGGGRPAVPHSVNSVGLQRRGFTAEQILNIRRAYRVLYRSGLKLKAALEELEKAAVTQAEIRPFVEFIKRSERSIVRVSRMVRAAAGGFGGGRGVRRHLGADLIMRCAASLRTPSSSASRARKCRRRGARSGSPPNPSPSWVCSRCCAICRACCACWRASATVSGRAAGCIRRHRCAGYQLATGAPACTPPASRRCNTSAPGLGVAAGPGAQHSPGRGSGAVPAALRKALLRRARHARGIRRASAGRCDSLTVDRRRRAAPSRSTRTPRWSPCCRGAGAAKWRGWREDFAATARWLAAQRPQLEFIAPMASAATRAIFSQALEQHAPGLARPAHRRPGANRADRRRCGPGGLRHGEPGGRAVQAPHGGRLSSGRDDRLDPAAAESGQNQVFRAAKSTCGSARRRRVFSGGNCPGVDRSRALDVARRCRTPQRLERSSRGFMPTCAATPAPAPRRPSCAAGSREPQAESHERGWPASTRRDADPWRGPWSQRR